MCLGSAFGSLNCIESDEKNVTSLFNGLCRVQCKMLNYLFDNKGQYNNERQRNH